MDISDIEGRVLRNFGKSHQAPLAQHPPSHIYEGFEPITILRSHPPEGRTLKDYVERFNIDLKDLHGHRVLDLGTGIKNRFAEGLREAGIKAKVISLSPDFIYSDIATQSRKSSPEGNQTAAIGQHLPFPDETFDNIYALHLWQHLQSYNAFKLVLSEMARTLKKGGKGMIGPYFDIPTEDHYFEYYSQDLQIISLLAKYGITPGKEDVSESVEAIKVKDRYANAFYVHGYSLVLQKPI